MPFLNPALRNYNYSKDNFNRIREKIKLYKEKINLYQGENLFTYGAVSKVKPFTTKSTRFFHKVHKEFYTNLSLCPLWVLCVLCV